MRAIWRGWRRGWRGPMRRWKCWPTAPSAISRCRDRGDAPQRRASFDAAAFAALPEEIRLRLLLRAIDRFGHEGPAELGKVEALLAALDQAAAEAPAARQAAKLKQTLAGALVSLVEGRIRVEPAPPRRRSADEAGSARSCTGRSKLRHVRILNHPRKTPASTPLFERELR